MLYGTERVLIPCAQLTGLTKLTFLDGTTVRVKGLTDIFIAAGEANLPIDAETAEMMLERLEKENYIPTSARQEYRNVILKEYRNYIAEWKK